MAILDLLLPQERIPAMANYVNCGYMKSKVDGKDYKVVWDKDSGDVWWGDTLVGRGATSTEEAIAMVQTWKAEH
jgi:hypothetical protein